MEELAPILTSPMTFALGAMNTLSPLSGTTTCFRDGIEAMAGRFTI
jgi:hypothetical protein